MKNKLTLLRIIETILQVIIVPLIIVTQFAYMTSLSVRLSQMSADR